MLKALSGERRCQILEAIAEQPKSISELALELELDQGTVSQHIQLMEQVGLVRSVMVSAVRGQAKMVHPALENIFLQLPACDGPREEEQEVEMPIGLYKDVHAEPSCGFATAHEMVYPQDSPAMFHHPKRTEAELIWLSDGYIEYAFPYLFPADAQPTLLEISAEICSEVHQYNEDYPSDITLWVNGIEIGTSRSPGDMGARPGKHTPKWVPETHTKFGFLKSWSANEDGFWVHKFEGASGVIGDLDLRPDKPIIVRFGFKEGTTHGGMNLFGAAFGDYDQAIRMRLVARPMRTAGEETISEVKEIFAGNKA